LLEKFYIIIKWFVQLYLFSIDNNSIWEIVNTTEGLVPFGDILVNPKHVADPTFGLGPTHVAGLTGWSLKVLFTIFDIIHCTRHFQNPIYIDKLHYTNL